jgi:hypothetical protein
MPGPEVQNLVLGNWSTQVKYEPTSEMPNGGTGAGTEIWRPGPGGLSVIEEYREKNEKGEVEGLGVAWWDAKAQGQRFVWCDNSIPDGCYVSKEVAKWDGGNLVWKEEQENAGKKRMYSEVFRNITPTSYSVAWRGRTRRASEDNCYDSRYQTFGRNIEPNRGVLGRSRSSQRNG